MINVPIAVVTLGLIMVAIPGRGGQGTREPVDFVGATLCVLGLAGPVFALIEAPKRGFSDPLILVSLIGGIVLFGLFLLWEQRTKSPMLPLRLFHRRNFSFANLETFTVYAALSTQGFFLTLFLQQLAGYSALQSGAASSPVTVVMFFLSPRVGRLSMRFGPRLFMGTGPFVCAAAVLWMRELTPDLDYWTDLLPPLLIFALGLSLIVAPLTATVLADAGPGDAGIASGVNNAIARVAGPARDRRRRRRDRGRLRPARPGRLPDGDGDHRRPARRRRRDRARRHPPRRPSATEDRRRDAGMSECGRDRVRPRHQALRGPRGRRAARSSR